ncbi:hypothetical protein PMAYCL1PPCAC_02628, partial [Pristionchus mayeri]
SSVYSRHKMLPLLAALFVGLLVVFVCGGKKQQQADFQFRSQSQEQPRPTPVNQPSTPVSGSNKREDTKKVSSEGLRPKTQKLNEKEQKIARGATKKPTEYPTFDDVPSDWEDVSSGEERGGGDPFQKDGKMHNEKKKSEKEEKKVIYSSPPHPILLFQAPTE